VPTYSYACTACEHHFDTVQKFTDPSLTDCPKCSGPLRKLFSSVGIVFKGSGFYRTDSRSTATAESGSNGKPDAKPGPGTDSKSRAAPTSPASGSAAPSSASSATAA
jgi:putative FmdB family regulatory protein